MTDKPAANDADARLATRRQSLLAISRFAAATAPAMLVLLSPVGASASSDGKESENGDGSDPHFNSHTGKHSHS